MTKTSTIRLFLFLFFFFHRDRFTIGQQITGNHRLVDIESLYSHYDYYTYRPCHGFESRFVGQATEGEIAVFHENLMSNNFRKTAVLKKNMNRKLRLHSNDSIKKSGGPYLCLNFSRRLPQIFEVCLQFFPENFPRQEEFFFKTNVQKTLIGGCSACQLFQLNPQD